MGYLQTENKGGGDGIVPSFLTADDNLSEDPLIKLLFMLTTFCCFYYAFDWIFQYIVRMQTFWDRRYQAVLSPQSWGSIQILLEIVTKKLENINIINKRFFSKKS